MIKKKPIVIVSLTLASKVRLYATYAEVSVNKQRAVFFDFVHDFPHGM